MSDQRFEHVDLARDVEVVRAGAQARVGHRLRGCRKRPGNVQYGIDLTQRRVERGRIGKLQHPVLKAERQGNRFELRFVAAGQNGLKAPVRRGSGGQLTCEPGRAVDQELPCLLHRQHPRAAASSIALLLSFSLYRRIRSGVGSSATLSRVASGCKAPSGPSSRATTAGRLGKPAQRRRSAAVSCADGRSKKMTKSGSASPSTSAPRPAVPPRSRDYDELARLRGESRDDLELLVSVVATLASMALRSTLSMPFSNRKIVSYSPSAALLSRTEL